MIEIITYVSESWAMIRPGIWQNRAAYAGKWGLDLTLRTNNVSNGKRFSCPDPFPGWIFMEIMLDRLNQIRDGDWVFRVDGDMLLDNMAIDVNNLVGDYDIGTTFYNKQWQAGSLLLRNSQKMRDFLAAVLKQPDDALVQEGLKYYEQGAINVLLPNSGLSVWDLGTIFNQIPARKGTGALCAHFTWPHSHEPAELFRAMFGDKMAALP